MSQPPEESQKKNLCPFEVLTGSSLQEIKNFLLLLSTPRVINMKIATLLTVSPPLQRLLTQEKP